MIHLSRDAFGRLWLHDAKVAGTEERAVAGEGTGAEAVAAAVAAQGVAVVPVRAFPLGAPDESIALVGADGREKAWVERLDRLPPEAAALVVEELGRREFTPEIRSIHGVSGWMTPCVWKVRTDRGDAELRLRSEDAIRRLPGGGLLIQDTRGFNFRVREIATLDPGSRRLLDRFL